MQSRPPSDGAPGATRRHPPGLFLLFGTEMWERFSYYGMRALLVLFLTDAARGGWGWSTENASRLYAWYTSLVYLTPVVGGYLADRFLGTHRCLLIGGAVIAAGHFSLALSSPTSFFVGLALIVIGTGFFKANVSTMVGQLYERNDPRRDGAFTIFYMGINIGALLGTYICGYLGESPAYGWHWGFGAAGVGMVLGLGMYLWGKPRYLGSIGNVPMARAAEPHGAIAAGGALPPEGSPTHTPLSREERDHVVAILILAFFSILFWLAFEQAGSSMNLFARDRTQRVINGFEIPASWFQSINPALVILCGPLFAGLWVRLGRRRGRPVSTALRMAAGLFLLGVGFVFMVAGALVSDGGTQASAWYLGMAFAFHTWGELCLSPVGLSMVSRLAPAKIASLLMGVWLLSSFVANLVGGYVAGLVERVERGEVYTLLGGQADFFLLFVVSSLGAGLLLLALTPLVNKLMHGKA